VTLSAPNADRENSGTDSIMATSANDMKLFIYGKIIFCIYKLSLLKRPLLLVSSFLESGILVDIIQTL
jgi:hypothetical protein